MEEYTQMAMDWIMAYGMNIVSAIAILIFGRIIVGILAGIVRRLMNRVSGDDTLTKFVVSLSRIIMMALSVFCRLLTLKMNREMWFPSRRMTSV